VWRARVWAKALRLEHWAKNLLVFAAPVLSRQVISGEVAWQSILLFVVMGALASATYVVNDLVDLEADRHHPRKRHRPFAAGILAPREGVVVATLLITGALTASLVLLPLGCTGSRFAYMVMSIG
jgi:4-hydroxybenzoate polyprenyltransferase